MEKKLVGGAKIKEELLFHGTTENVISAICQQNFDHRLSGTRSGAAYGQGRYHHTSSRTWSTQRYKTSNRGINEVDGTRRKIGKLDFIIVKKYSRK